MADAVHNRECRTCECGEHAFVNLTKWGVALVSPEDATMVADRLWHLTSSRNERRAYAKSGPYHMHREVLGCGDGQLPDHINRNGLDNRRHNLRVADPSTNQFNKRTQIGKRSKYKGVRFCKKLADGSDYWKSAIEKDGKQTILGHFKDDREAALAYDAAAIVAFGDFAATNASLGLL